MAELTDYEGLKAVVADYLGRDDLADRIPDFIRLAEARLNRDVRMRVMERRAYHLLDAGKNELSLPWKREAGDWDVFLEMRDLVWRCGGRTVNLTYLPADDYSTRLQEQGSPVRYAIVGKSLFIVPVPDQRGQVELTYWAEIPPLSDAQPANAVLETAPDLYLYAALVESAPWARSSVPVELWTQYYREARERVRESENRGRYTANVRMRPCRRI